MALPAIGAFLIKEGVTSLAWIGGLTVIEDYIVPYFTSDVEDIAIGDETSGDQTLNNNLLEEAIPDFERTIIKVALNKTMGRKKEAAELLGWGRNTLTRKIKELGLDN